MVGNISSPMTKLVIPNGHEGKWPTVFQAEIQAILESIVTCLKHIDMQISVYFQTVQLFQASLGINYFTERPVCKEYCRYSRYRVIVEL